MQIVNLKSYIVNFFFHRPVIASALAVLQQEDEDN